MPKAVEALTSSTSRRAVLGITAAAVVAPGAALAAAPGVAGDDLLLELQRRYLAVSQASHDAWDRHENAKWEARHGTPTGEDLAALEAAANALQEEWRSVRCELTSAPVTSLAGVGVKVRLLVAGGVQGEVGDEADLALSVLDFVARELGADQRVDFEPGVMEDIERRLRERAAEAAT